MTTHLTPDELSEIDACIERRNMLSVALIAKMRAHIAQLEALASLARGESTDITSPEEWLSEMAEQGHEELHKNWARLLKMQMETILAHNDQLSGEVDGLQRKLDHANKRGIEYRQELDKLRDIHQGSVRHRTELADANSGLRVHAAQLERDLDDANTTIAAMLRWAEHHAERSVPPGTRQSGYRDAACEVLGRLQQAPTVEPTHADAIGGRVEKRRPSAFAQRIEADMREAAVGEVGCHLARLQKQLDRHETLLRALAAHVDTDGAHDVRRAVNALESP